jgi:amino acid transporter
MRTSTLPAGRCMDWRGTGKHPNSLCTSVFLSYPSIIFLFAVVNHLLTSACLFYRRCTKSGVPFCTVTLVQLIGCLTFMVASESSTTVFYWFIDLTTCALIISYVMMFVTFIGYVIPSPSLDRSSDRQPTGGTTRSKRKA